MYFTASGWLFASPASFTICIVAAKSSGLCPSKPSVFSNTLAPDISLERRAVPEDTAALYLAFFSLIN